MAPWSNGSGGGGGGSSSSSGSGGSLAPARCASRVQTVLSGLQTINGVAQSANDRTFLFGQTDGKENGPWLAQAGAWTRPTDYVNASAQLSGLQIRVSDADNLWGGYEFTLSTTGAITVGTTATTWQQFSGPSRLSDLSGMGVWWPLTEATIATCVSHGRNTGYAMTDFVGAGGTSFIRVTDVASQTSKGGIADGGGAGAGTSYVYANTDGFTAYGPQCSFGAIYTPAGLPSGDGVIVQRRDTGNVHWEIAITSTGLVKYTARTTGGVKTCTSVTSPLTVGQPVALCGELRSDGYLLGWIGGDVVAASASGGTGIMDYSGGASPRFGLFNDSIAPAANRCASGSIYSPWSDNVFYFGGTLSAISQRMKGLMPKYV